MDYWHSQTAVTVGARGADKEEVKRLARQLRRDYGSQTEVEDYLPELQWLADNRQNKKAKFADMMQTAENVARQVLDGCRVNVNEEQMETMKALKKFLRGRYINVDESLKEDIGDFKDFKKLNRALHFREDGSGTALYDNRYDTETQSYRLDFSLDLNATVGGSGRIDLLSKYEVGLVPQDTQGQDVT